VRRSGVAGCRRGSSGQLLEDERTPSAWRGASPRWWLDRPLGQRTARRPDWRKRGAGCAGRPRRSRSAEAGPARRPCWPSRAGGSGRSRQAGLVRPGGRRSRGRPWSPIDVVEHERGAWEATARSASRRSRAAASVRRAGSPPARIASGEHVWARAIVARVARQPSPVQGPAGEICGPGGTAHGSPPAATGTGVIGGRRRLGTRAQQLALADPGRPRG
jgi:hypothetical protein